MGRLINPFCKSLSSKMPHWSADASTHCHATDQTFLIIILSLITLQQAKLFLVTTCTFETLSCWRLFFFILTVFYTDRVFRGKAKYTSIMQWHFYTFENLCAFSFSFLCLTTLIPYYDFQFKVMFLRSKLAFLVSLGFKLVRIFSTMSYQSWIEQNKYFSCLT